MKEKNGEKEVIFKRSGEVEISDVDPHTLKLLLEFIYTGQVGLFNTFYLILDCSFSNSQLVIFLAVHRQLNRTHCPSVRLSVCLTKLTTKVFTTLQSDPRDL